MHQRRLTSYLIGIHGLCFIGYAIAGCDSASLLLNGGDNSTNETLVMLASAGGSESVVTEDDTGQAFSAAQAIELREAGKTKVRGVLQGTFDIDVYRFGPVHTGDVVIADVQSPGMNTRVALFDELQAVIEANDDRNYYGGNRDPLLQTTARREHDIVYLAIAGVPDASSYSSTGSQPAEYTVTITHGSGVPIPPSQPQVVWLEFGGQRAVRIAGERPQDVPAFDAAAIHPRHKAREGEILDRMIALIKADYADYNIEILRSDRDARPSGPLTALYFGAYSTVYLGLADSVDWFNSEQQQEAIIYTQTLSLFESMRPTDEEVAQAIANVAAHELGHLLGLDHTDDLSDLMAEAGSAQQLLTIDAALTLAPLAQGVFPMGMQNAPVKVAYGVGLRDPQKTIDDLLKSTAAQRGAKRNDAARSRLRMDGATLESLGLRMCRNCAH